MKRKNPFDPKMAEELSNDYLRVMIELAAAGNRDAATGMLEAYCASVDVHEVPNWQILRYFSEAFRRMLDGDDPRSVLHLKRVRGRPASFTKHLDLACEVKQRRDCGADLSEAIQVTAKKNHVSPSTVKKAYDKHRKDAQWLVQDPNK